MKHVNQVSSVCLVVAVWVALVFPTQYSKAQMKADVHRDVPQIPVYIVPTGDAVYDAALKKAFHEVWTVSPLANADDLGNDLDLKDPNRSFVMQWEGMGFHALMLIRGGGKTTLEAIDDSDVMASSAIGVDQPNSILYRLPLIVSTLQQNLIIRTSPDKNVRRLQYSDLAYRLKGKKLLFEGGEWNKDEVDVLKQNYEYDVEITTREVIADAVEERRVGHALLWFSRGSPFTVYVHDLETGECILTEPWISHSVSQRHVSPKNVKQMSSLIGKVPK